MKLEAIALQLGVRVGARPCRRVGHNCVGALADAKGGWGSREHV